MAKPFYPLVDRFWPKVARADGACWLWTASVDSKGYGQIRMAGRLSPLGRAHRISWEMRHGEIADGLYVLHRCDNRRCVNPDHLFLGTHEDNMRDMMAKGRESHDTRQANDGRGRLTASFTMDEARKIRGRALSGETAASLAEEFGVSRSLIHGVRAGRRRYAKAA